MDLKGLYKSNRRRFNLIILLLFLTAFANTMSSYLYKPAVDYLAKDNLKNTLYYFFIMILIGLLSIVIEAFAQTVYSKQVQEYLGLLRQKIVAHFYAKNDTSVSEMQNNLSSNLDMLSDNYAMPLQTIISNSFTLIMIIGVLIQLNWSLLVLTAVLAVINLLTPKIMEKATDKANKQVSIENSRLLKAIDYWMGGMKELRRYSSFLALFNAMNKSNQKLEDSNVQSTKTMSLSIFISDFTNVASQILFGVWAGILFFQGKLSIGATLVAEGFASQIFNALFVYEQAIIQFKSIKTVNNQIKELKKDISESNEKLDSDLAELEIKDLTVKYDQGEEISYPNIQVSRGEKILLSGDSGTGKSTLFKAILGQIKPQKGKILFKNSEGKAIKPNLGKIGYIAQDSVLFPDTIKNNITMFNSKLDDQVDRITKDVQLETDLARFPDGTSTVIDLDSDNLSGGQKQKIILARTQIHHSQFVLMDEATSAIDSIATKKILQKLLESDATLILIAHNFDQQLRSMFDREIHLVGGNYED
ncbi:ABC transporter ATP-binding protein [Lactobacillus acidophilus]|uniref:ATP-binding cassette domain-containing protein n=1 Tax=Lactobacillus acidophilus TaxID=1579 RepID=UPI0021A7A4A7|nr:ABC transporter ATP-binding protein [Lactobacillus acidophilus]MCT3602519.1 ABC transporter ATP-binding protein [Lactobacillus acidophilus]MCT3623555.1 ABC transporter ATP-binding protein [Lactobacillus acidophilus]